MLSKFGVHSICSYAIDMFVIPGSKVLPVWPSIFFRTFLAWDIDITNDVMSFYMITCIKLDSLSWSQEQSQNKVCKICHKQTHKCHIRSCMLHSVHKTLKPCKINREQRTQHHFKHMFAFYLENDNLVLVLLAGLTHASVRAHPHTPVIDYKICSPTISWVTTSFDFQIIFYAVLYFPMESIYKTENMYKPFIRLNKSWRPSR
jgi:hypothetical protein